MDLPLLLGTPGAWSDAPMMGPDRDPVNHELARDMRRLWSRFAYDGVEVMGAERLSLDAAC